MEGNTRPATVMPLRPLGVGELLDTAARLVRRNLRASFAITLPVEVVRTVVVALVAYATVGDVSDTQSPLPTVGPGASLGSSLLQIFIGSLTFTFLSGLLAPLFVEDALGNRQTATQALRRVGRSWLPLLALTIVVALGLELGLVLLIVGGVFLWGAWALAAPALVIERVGPFRALRRSATLVRGHFWRVWGTRALGWFVATVLAVFVTLPTGLLAVWLGTNEFDDSSATLVRPLLYVTILALGSLLVNLVLSPFRAAVDALLYLDARMGREGMDLTLALDADDRAAAAATPAPATSTW